MTEPHSHTSDMIAVNLVTVGNYQFAVWYDLAGELHIGRITRGTHQWGVNHQEYTFAGTPRTALALPVEDDTHNFPAVTVDGLGIIHVFANMHTNTLRAAKTSATHTSDGWLATGGWVSATADVPGIGAHVTYPIPVRFDDGTIWLYFRDGPSGALGSGAGNSDSHWWTRGPAASTWSGPNWLFQGINVPGAGPGGTVGSDHSVNDDTNWNAYPTIPVIESARTPHPGRLHIAWVWRVSILGRPCLWPSYMYSDDKGVTWAAIDGTPVTLPVHPLNNPAVQTGMTETVHVDGYINDLNLAVDDIGLPHFFLSHTPVWYIHRNPTNTAWVQTEIVSPLGPGAGHGLQGTAGAFWMRERLWMLRTTGTSAARNFTPRALSIDETMAVRLGGEVDSFGEWDPSYDPEAYRRFGTIETLCPDGNIPRVYVFGRGARTRAA